MQTHTANSSRLTGGDGELRPNWDSCDAGTAANRPETRGAYEEPNDRGAAHTVVLGEQPDDGSEELEYRGAC